MRSPAPALAIPDWEPCPLDAGEGAITRELLDGGLFALHRRTLRFLCALEAAAVDVDGLPGVGKMLADLGRIDGLVEAGMRRFSQAADAEALARWAAIGKSASEALSELRRAILSEVKPEQRRTVASAERTLRALDVRGRS